ncbi:MAG: hypothetical protein OEW83_08825 [Acidimicrobiia bacterium]|nr:hypothetical protein [Acidimicrobiia bacterium]
MASSFADLFDDPDLRRTIGTLPVSAKLKPGERTPKQLTVPVKSIQPLIRSVGRVVSDLPDDEPNMVWTDGFNELVVRTDSLRLNATTGLIRLSVSVDCDQLAKPLTVTVPFAVGTKDKVTGMVMTTFDVVEGPAAVVDLWADAITAFCWECVLELVRGITAKLGNDGSGRALIPGSLAAAPNTLIIHPMARHKLPVATKG